MRIFNKHDEQMMTELYQQTTKDADSYISLFQQQSADLDELMALDMIVDVEILDKAWSVKHE